MRFVVYHIASTMSAKTFDSEAGAKRSTTCMNRNAGSTKYAYTTIENYNKNVVKMVERVNLLSGQKYMEASNTPNYCSPASESYWSM